MDGHVSDQEQEIIALPVLRDDLDIVPTAPLANGAPAWVIFDPVANRYFEIGRELLDMLILWRVGDADKLIASVGKEFGRVISRDDVGDAIHFMISNALVRDIPGNDFAMMATRAMAEKKSWWSTAMHSYLFFRIPLFRPDKFLRATWPIVAPLFSKTAVWIYVLIAVLGLYLVSRQWDQFTGTFQLMLSWQGMALYGLSLVVVKSLHELGHAYMSVRYGLRVPTIGIAFMVLMPVLYTDTSGAWRLKSRRKRLMIDGAGIFTELTLAALATFIWAFLPDGGLRLCVFAIAATSWVTSLAVNLNPLMRFDGYYILSDSLGFQNLQNRGFDMARWRMRELLFGLGEAPPELLTTKMRRTVILHAWATWIYRFFLFLGIAILVYAFFIKIVGIILFAVEILWFILLPIWREMRHWWDIKDKIMISPRIIVTGLTFAGLMALAIVPWSTQITIPSLMTAQQEQSLYAPLPGHIVSVSLEEGRQVLKGDVLAKLEAPQMALQMKAAKERASLLETRIDRSGADAQDRASLIVLTNELEEVREQIKGLNRLSKQMIIRAPFDGRIVDADRELHNGLWVNPTTVLAVIQADKGVRIKGYVAETSLFRFAAGSQATFIPDNRELPKIHSIVKDVAVASSEKLDEPYLALRFGGSILTEEGGKQELKPKHANYAVAFVPTDENLPRPRIAVRGVSVIIGQPESFYLRAKRQVLKVLVRELGV